MVPSLGGVDPNKKAGLPESFSTCTRCSLDLNPVRSLPSRPLSTRENGIGSKPATAVLEVPWMLLRRSLRVYKDNEGYK